MTIRPITKRARTESSGWRSMVVFAASVTALVVYLFVTAPPPLAAAARDERTVPIATVLSLLELENDAARTLWTEEIVHRGLASGFAFGEHWQQPNVHEGPLPALFLRETARQLERSPVRVRLFLGSLHPINAANKLTGEQATRFVELERTGVPQVFYEPSTAMHTAMFVDRAVVEQCVSCHNQHRESPKTDWRLNDVMGATTWMYPEGSVSIERAVEMIGALRASMRAAYASYLSKAATFPRAPVIGTRWPRDGYFLPSTDAFMAELGRRTSTATVQGLIDPGSALAAAAGEPVRATGEPANRGAGEWGLRVVGKPGSRGLAESNQAVTAPGASTADGAAPPAASGESTGATPAAAPTLVIRAARATRVSVSRHDSRLMVVRLGAGGATSLNAHPPLRVVLGQGAGVEVEYAGRRVALPAPDDDGDIELDLPVPVEGS